MTKEARSTKLEIRHSSFGFRHSFVIRHSCFVISSSTNYQLRWLLLIVTGLFSLSGASCPHLLQQYTNPLPRRLARLAAADVGAGHRRGEQEQLADSIVFDESRLDQRPGLPLAVDEHRLRAAAGIPHAGGTSIVGAELDLGSNDELFWFWVKRSQPPAIYYCRHDQFAASQARQMTPFEPRWLIEALGVVEFDRSLPNKLTVLPNDRLRIDTIRNTPEGPMTKVTILDGSQGWVLEQHLYDARRRLVARSIASGHRQDPLERPGHAHGRADRLARRRNCRCGSTWATSRSTVCRAIGRRCGRCRTFPARRRSNMGDPNFHFPSPANGRHHPSPRNARRPAAPGAVAVMTTPFLASSSAASAPSTPRPPRSRTAMILDVRSVLCLASSCDDDRIWQWLVSSNDRKLRRVLRQDADLQNVCEPFDRVTTPAVSSTITEAIRKTASPCPRSPAIRPFQG